MEAESTVKRIGGSNFALLPPDLSRELDLKPGDSILIVVRRLGKTLDEMQDLKGSCPGVGAFTAADRREMWGDYGER